jgi:hypothetical protein
MIIMKNPEILASINPEILSNRVARQAEAGPQIFPASLALLRNPLPSRSMC